MKKILFIHHGTGVGGAAWSLIYTIEALDKKRFDPSVIFMKDSAAVDIFKKRGIRPIEILEIEDYSHSIIWWYRFWHIKHLFKAIVGIFNILFSTGPKVLKKYKPDVLHLNTTSLWPWAICAKYLKIPVVCHVREPLANGYIGLRKIIIKFVVRFYSNAIVAISNHDGAPWRGNLKLSIVHNFVPKEFLAEGKEPAIFEQKRPKEILFLGGLSKTKGTLLLLEAFDLVLKKQPKARLVIAGSFDIEKPRLGNLFGLSPNARFCARVAHLLFKNKNNIDLIGVVSDVRALFTRCTLLAWPAIEGHFARPIIEASFYSKPVVATNFPPHDELVTNQTGILTNANPIDFSNGLLKILNSQELAGRMAIAGHLFARKNFLASVQIKKIEAVYTKLSESIRNTV